MSLLYYFMEELIAFSRAFPCRPFPAEEYTVREFAHKGPLSRTVTLTYPYNPYNKVENRAEEIENKW